MTAEVKQVYESEKLSEKLGAIEDIVKYLNSRIETWSFPRLLSEASNTGESLQECLERKLLEYTPSSNPETIARNVRNWLSGRNLPSNREELFRICFALELNEKDTEYILGTTAESGIHFRNPRELIYAYCLRKKIDYPQAVRLVEELWKAPLPEKTIEYQAFVKETSETEDRKILTASIRNQFKRVQTEEELWSFLEEYHDSFGIHHNTAYRKFSKMLENLLAPENLCADLPVDRVYSIEKAVNEYLRAGMPYEKRLSGGTVLQKKIKEHWPTAKSIREMYSRKLDVSRKALMLLYVATEGMVTDWRGTPKDWLRSHYKRLDLMLRDCGMAELNLHSPFDFLIMQALHKENEDDFMGYRLEWMIRKLYPEKETIAFVTAEADGKQKKRGNCND